MKFICEFIGGTIFVALVTFAFIWPFVLTDIQEYRQRKKYQGK